MNPLLLILFAGVAVAVAASASGGSDSPSGPMSEEDRLLVESSERLVRIYELYTTPYAKLTSDEIDELAHLNAEAKGITYVPLEDLAKAYMASGIQKTPLNNFKFITAYRRQYWLPPGVNEEKGPDVFSGWGQAEPIMVCHQFYVTGECQYGGYYDWFGRLVGAHIGDGTVHGQSDLKVIADGFYDGLTDIWKDAGSDILRGIADVASNYPGIGTVIASGVTFLEAVGSGASLEEASLSAGRAAVPSTLRAAYDVGVGLATKGELDVKAALSVAMAAAISQGVIDGAILEKFETIKSAYEDASEVRKNLGHLGTVVNVAAP